MQFNPHPATFIVNGLADVTDRAKTTIAVGNEGMLRNLLRAEFTTIRLGTLNLNHCLGDPAKSLRLEGASAAVKAGGLQRHGVLVADHADYRQTKHGRNMLER